MRKPKYIVMAMGHPSHVIARGYGVNLLDCVVVSKENRGVTIMGLIPSGMKVLRFRHSGNYNLSALDPIPDDYHEARRIRYMLVDEARNG